MMQGGFSPLLMFCTLNLSPAAVAGLTFISYLAHDNINVSLLFFPYSAI